MEIPTIKTAALRKYLEVVKDTEAPPLFHLWSALGMFSAALGRRCWLPFGVSTIWPNQYIALVGPPATKKNTALGFARRFLHESTSVRFAPADTAGAKQGLIIEIENKEGEDEDAFEVIANGADEDEFNLDSILNTELRSSGKPKHGAREDRHAVCLYSTEFSQVLAGGDSKMLEFLTRMWDSDAPYEYRTARRKIILQNPNPLLNIMGGTTPAALAEQLPGVSAGQGFLSRLILVYAPKKYKKVPRPRRPDETLVNEIRETVREIDLNFNGQFVESKAAFKATEDLYEEEANIEDPRFAYYKERRQIHMLKLGMALAAARGSMQIEADDYYQAHAILQITEEGMPDALGQFGLNSLAAVKQNILQYLRSKDEPIHPEIILAAFLRDANRKGIAECVSDLITEGHVKQAVSKITGDQLILAVRKDHKSNRQLTDLFSDEEAMRLLNE